MFLRFHFQKWIDHYFGTPIYFWLSYIYVYCIFQCFLYSVLLHSKTKVVDQIMQIEMEHVIHNKNAVKKEVFQQEVVLQGNSYFSPFSLSLFKFLISPRVTLFNTYCISLHHHCTIHCHLQIWCMLHFCDIISRKRLCKLLIYSKSKLSHCIHKYIINILYN